MANGQGRRRFMRRLIWAFVIVSPVIAFAQADHATLSVPAGTHLAAALATKATIKMSEVIHAAQSWLA
jgi:hypothetical protein